MAGRIEHIEQFEKGLIPSRPESSGIKARILGYGEISTVFEIEGLKGKACKRMPLFNTVADAEKYQDIYRQYCNNLKNAGLQIAQSQTQVVSIPGKPVTLYIIQELLKKESFAHQLIHDLSNEKVGEIIEAIVLEIIKIKAFNICHAPGLALALDGQLSNWAKKEDRFVYIDTSTPMFRVNDKEQLDPELFLKSAPSFLRWIIRLFFLKGVMDRYYDFRSILVDLVANLYKEQRGDLVPGVLPIINKHLPKEEEKITQKEIVAYYKEDKLIWKIFLSFRRLDRWIKTRIFFQQYDYILPGRIKR